jgi:hypothetical protein
MAFIQEKPRGLPQFPREKRPSLGMLAWLHGRSTSTHGIVSCIKSYDSAFASRYSREAGRTKSAHSSKGISKRNQNSLTVTCQNWSDFFFDIASRRRPTIKAHGSAIVAIEQWQPDDSKRLSLLAHGRPGHASRSRG